MRSMNLMYLADGYKLDHRRQYPQNTQYVYSNWTARGTRHSDINKVPLLGLQAYLQMYMQEWANEFFSCNVDEVCAEYEKFLLDYLGPNDIGSDHIRALHKLGYMPLEFRSLPEGTHV